MNPYAAMQARGVRVDMSAVRRIERAVDISAVKKIRRSLMLDDAYHLVIPRTWLTGDRDDMVVLDAHGLAHASVLCNNVQHVGTALEGSDPEGIVTVDMSSPRTDATSFLVAMCDYCEMFDDVESPTAFTYPERRWPLEQEAPGVVTCLFCLAL